MMTIDHQMARIDWDTLAKLTLTNDTLRVRFCEAACSAKISGGFQSIKANSGAGP
jgi:hypothetical protein